MNIYLNFNRTARDRIPKDLSSFKQLYDKVEKDLVVAKKRLSQKNLRSVQDEDDSDEDEDYHKALAVCMECTPEKDITDAEKIITSLNWSLVKFEYEWRKNRQVMRSQRTKTFTGLHRVSKRIGERLLVMSGLTWNIDSRSMDRDWVTTITAITLETGIVGTYRKDLLMSCPGACLLRKEIQEYLKSIAIRYLKNNPTDHSIQSFIEWEFPDGIPLDIGTCGGKHYDPSVLRKELDESNSTGARSKGKHDVVHRSIQSLAKNKLLWSSEPDVENGTLETLAYHCLSTLSHVGYSFSLIVCLL